MNPEARVLQALDEVQDAFRHFREMDPDSRSEIAHEVHKHLSTAPWPMATRANEAMTHGWLGQIYDSLQRIEDVPDGDDVMDRIDEGLWAANELERDLRQLVEAR